MADSMAVMAEDRVRITIDLPDAHRRALNIIAAMANVSAGRIIEQLLGASYPEELELARKAITRGEPADKPRRGRRPRAD